MLILRRCNNWICYFLLVVVFILLITISNALQTEEFIRSSLSGQYSNKVISNYLESREKWAWLGYTLIPLLILLRTSIIAFLMQMAVFFIDTENETPFRKFWSVTLSAEWITVLLIAFRFVYFSAINTNYTFEELQGYTPLTIADIYDTSRLESWLAYPFNILSIWELLYWAVLIFGIHDIMKTNFFKSFGIVLASYGVGLLIWVGFVMYMLLTTFTA